MGEMIEFPSNGGRCPGYLAEPAGGQGPGVLVIQEWWGLVPHIKDVCDRLAREGFWALAPDLYHGKQVSEPDEAGKAMMAMQLDQAAKDMSGAADELRRRSGRDRVGVVGFCMGGGLALVLACRRPDAIAACVPFYGVIPWPNATPDYSQLSGAVQGHFAEHDDFFPPEKARELEAELRRLGKQAEIFVYDGTSHAFFNDDRPEVYHEQAAALAWGRTLDFLRTQLA
ncbi:dienelactone hydrolase family protein [Aciditerrimonas ferrireducens]|uniref:dienelactone hydrolase family protein n=1 Tax=Aciditerrimonas ferrireducens TaxID=667306 RepID=UPI0020042CDF|nr:dienelactone hydrolase family protein [Aciditerrimonas ferrireducens]MCK4176413.1 dienelactone hydrolase family protein [Aciditerrimonas ferrireducens]